MISLFILAQPWVSVLGKKMMHCLTYVAEVAPTNCIEHDLPVALFGSLRMVCQ